MLDICLAASTAVGKVAAGRLFAALLLTTVEADKARYLAWLCVCADEHNRDVPDASGDNTREQAQELATGHWHEDTMQVSCLLGKQPCAGLLVPDTSLLHCMHADPG